VFFSKRLIPCADEGFIRQHDEKYPTNKGKLDTIEKLPALLEVDAPEFPTCLCCSC
jgi:hypothetical protein